MGFENALRLHFGMIEKPLTAGELRVGGEFFRQRFVGPQRHGVEGVEKPSIQPQISKQTLTEKVMLRDAIHGKLLCNRACQKRSPPAIQRHHTTPMAAT